MSDNRTHEREDKDGDLRRKFQETFDVRYVLREGEYWIIRALVFGMAVLALTAVGSLLLGIAHLPTHPAP